MGSSTIIKDRWFGEEIPDNADLNDYIKPGYYTSFENCSTYSNSPYNNDMDFQLRVEPNSTPLGLSTSKITQITYKYNDDDEVYYRVYNGSTWSAWTLAKEQSASGSVIQTACASTSGTTTKHGNLKLDVAAPNTIISIYCTNIDGVIVTAMRSTASNLEWWAHCVTDAATPVVLASTNVTIEYWYI